MKAWLQSSISYYTGTAEPVYGPEAIQPVTASVQGINPFHRLEADDFKWSTPSSSHVETQVFYIKPNEGDYMCFVQLIHSNLGSWTTTAQSTCRIFDLKHPENDLWTSTNMDQFSFENDKTSFVAKNCSVVLEDQKRYRIRASINMDSIIDITVHQDAPPFKIGEDGNSTYGTDPSKPWASMKHTFWPRTRVEGSIVARGRVVDVTGPGMFVHALQNGKPHHLASSWEFALLQHKKFTAIMMQFKTPPSYGSTIVNIGGIAMKDKIISATVDNTIEHVETTLDPDTEWHEPTRISYEWDGKDAETYTEDIHLSVDAPLGRRLQRIDVLAEIPSWLKGFVHGVSGTKPFIYQYFSPVKFTLKMGDEVIEDEATLFNETTFIS
ncbi:ER to Golgi ceramide transport protein, lipocalin superfamily Svf1 [Schizosaccharomyces pombe]|uniref:Ceramide-binding protein svf1 n=1 Tax=Schizosaccharomyces pombe (strain 972 / ATCC 24843) TaxID=284812 RepID=SVF1_SCHPO|nr:Svf1 family protein Svf1 [Schizosaccharomyces pombe]Q09885.1 RecName: Full=Ceramide-binding protein svf1; AltName: Full=Survival factor 1 [Schizosaccharomyces pombe 972h-]CAB37424.1 Svf1 family protein Svf1 [Schizosaccharomyces pombe]|eukprot:NP_588216.1 Svf1 family protein Svf1 [Schizosaccharomyces pombe]